MAKEYYCRLCHKFVIPEGRTSGYFEFQPDLPDSILFGGIGTSIDYIDDATSIVRFKRDLTPEEEALIAKHSAARMSLGKPVYDPAMRPKAAALAEAREVK